MTNNKSIRFLIVTILGLAVYSPALLGFIGNDRVLAAAVTFAPRATYAEAIDTSGSFDNLATGDLNGDGRADLVTADTGGFGGIAVFMNSGNGTYSAKVVYPTIDPQYGLTAIPYTIKIADVNGDGKPDIVAHSPNYSGGLISVFLNNGNGTFAPAKLYSGIQGSFHFVLADVNGDCKPDIIMTNDNNAQIAVFMNDGNGAFPSAARYNTPSGLLNNLDVADVNGDGKPDIVASDSNLGVLVMMNNGTGAFGNPVVYPDDRPAFVKVADVNHDGKADVITAGGFYGSGAHTWQTSVFINKGNGIFASRVSYSAAGQIMGLAIGDLDGDANPDIALTQNNTNSISVLTNNGNGTYAAAQSFATGGSPASVVVGDLNGDGRADIINTESGDISVLLNRGTFTVTTAKKVASSCSRSHSNKQGK